MSDAKSRKTLFYQLFARIKIDFICFRVEMLLRGTHLCIDLLLQYL